MWVMVLGCSSCRRRWDKVRGGPADVAKPAVTPKTSVQPQLGWKRSCPAALRAAALGGAQGGQ